MIFEFSQIFQDVIYIPIKLFIKTLEEFHVATEQRSGFFSNGSCECEIVIAQNKKCLCFAE